MEVSGQRHAPPALPPEKGPPVTHLIGGWVGPRVGLNAVARIRNPSTVDPILLGNLSQGEMTWTCGYNEESKCMHNFGGRTS
jgi:hypothetical protein